MRVVASVGMIALCLGLTGCSMFGKKSNTAAPNPTSRPPGPGPAPVPSPFGPGSGPAASPEQPASLTSPFSGILAGQVKDSYDRRPPPTYIKPVQVKDRDGKEHAPIELDWVATDSNGYFTIQSLQPGRHYQLIAVAKDGARKLAGATWAMPPDPRVFITISEDFAKQPNIPDPPSSPGATKPNKPAESSQIPPPDWSNSPAVGIGQPGIPGTGNTSSPSGSLRRAVELGQPVPRSPGTSPNSPEPATKPAPAGGVSPFFVADGRPSAPLVEIPNRPRDSIGSLTQPAFGPPGTTMPPSAAPVPFCVLTGYKLDNFALNDLNGQPWEFKKHRRGRLVLLDFWWTNCIPCRQAMPHLKNLHDNYRSYGLEIVSIAYETGTVEEQVRKVKSIRDRYASPYTMLLGNGLNAKCPVRTQFQVANFPTLVLLDETGQIIWRSEGLDEQARKELDFEIRRRLGLR